MEAKSGEGGNPSQNKRKRMTVALCVILAAGALMTLLYFLPYDTLLERIFSKDEAGQPEDIYFYEKDFETDILSDTEYTELNRYISIKIGVETFTVTDGDFSRYGHGSETVAAYIDAMMRGDNARYNALFTDAYYAEHEPLDAFPMQRLYDITLTLQSEHTFTEDELNGRYTGVTQVKYLVEYCIQYNDGSVRSDVGSGVCAPIIMELLSEPDSLEMYINSISKIYKK